MGQNDLFFIIDSSKMPCIPYMIYNMVSFIFSDQIVLISTWNLFQVRIVLYDSGRLIQYLRNLRNFNKIYAFCSESYLELFQVQIGTAPYTFKWLTSREWPWQKIYNHVMPSRNISDRYDFARQSIFVLHKSVHRLIVLACKSVDIYLTQIKCLPNRTNHLGPKIVRLLVRISVFHQKSLWKDS